MLFSVRQRLSHLVLASVMRGMIITIGRQIKWRPWGISTMTTIGLTLPLSVCRSYQQLLYLSCADGFRMTGHFLMSSLVSSQPTLVNRQRYKLQVSVTCCLAIMMGKVPAR